MAEVTSEMGAELRASALAAGTSVAAEVGRRLERLARLEDRVDQEIHPDIARSPYKDWDKPRPPSFSNKPKPERNESLYSGSPNPWDMFRNTSSGR